MCWLRIRRGYVPLLGKSGGDVGWSRTGVKGRRRMVLPILSGFPGRPDSPAFFEELGEEVVRIRPVRECGV
jgi:hypothetical protein